MTSAKVQKGLKETNGLWNRERLNSQFIWGNLSTIIQKGHPNSVEEWQKYYFYSGQLRQAHLKRLTEEKQKELSDYNGRFQYRKATSKINLDFGRTREEFDQFVEYSYEKYIKKWYSLNLTLEDWREIVSIHIFQETFNGYYREICVVKTLKERFPEYEINKVSGEVDFLYGIDFVFQQKDKLLLAIQIKPMSYFYGLEKGLPHLIEAECINQNKQRKLYQLKDIETSTIYSESGEVNEEKIEEIRKRLEEKIKK